MNLIQQQWKSQSEFSRFNQIDIEEIKTFHNSMPIREEDDDTVRIYFNNVVLSDLYKIFFHNINSEQVNVEEGLTAFQKYLLSWPEMSDEEYNYVQEKRKHFNEWK